MKAKSQKSSASAKKAKKDPIFEFYNNHPYPPPLDNLDRARELYQNENIHRAEFHLLWPDKEYRSDLDVLVAGCGTWQAAKFALCHPAARVVGVDLSTTSLEHTNKLKQKYNLENLETRQLAIESVNELERKFDFIVCTGVLHHLADTEAGLRALASVLKPDGAMYLMIYAPYGRAGVYMFQEYCRRLEIGTSSQEIHDLIGVLQQLPQNHPLLATQDGSRDFITGDALADALLNPRDRAFSVSQLLELLAGAGLRLGRWYWQAPYLPQCGAFAQTPHADRLAKQPAADQYVAMELWRGLMPNHSMVVHPKNSKNSGARIKFDDERLSRYVPVRLPWTVCVQEGLPPGAAGVLVNQTHMFSDLYLVINETEKRMFEAINGRRNIDEIVALASENGDAPQAREFFEKLWQYDQVVFNTSQA